MRNDLNNQVPATVNVVFPRTDGSTYVVSVDLATLAIDDLSTIDGYGEWLLYSTAFGGSDDSSSSSSSGSDDPLNNAELVSLAHQWAKDNVLWDLAYLDVVFRGVADWQPEGMHDIEISCRGEEYKTRVLRAPWPAGSTGLHYGAYGSQAGGGGSGGGGGGGVSGSLYINVVGGVVSINTTTMTTFINTKIAAYNYTTIVNALIASYDYTAIFAQFGLTYNQTVFNQLNLLIALECCVYATMVCGCSYCPYGMPFLFTIYIPGLGDFTLAYVSGCTWRGALDNGYIQLVITSGAWTITIVDGVSTATYTWSTSSSSSSSSGAESSDCCSARTLLWVNDSSSSSSSGSDVWPASLTITPVGRCDMICVTCLAITCAAPRALWANLSNISAGCQAWFGGHATASFPIEYGPHGWTYHYGDGTQIVFDGCNVTFGDYAAASPDTFACSPLKWHFAGVTMHGACTGTFDLDIEAA